MYAESRYTPPKSRAVSLGAAFAINGLILAGLIFSAPEFVKKIGPTVLPIRDYVDPVPPPPDEPKPQPRTEAPKPTAPLPNVPDPIIKTPTDNPIEGTTTIYPPQPPFEPAKADPGPTVQPEPLKAAPPLPLIGAARDARYAEDFQPAYPSSELRAQRDGTVKVRVLVGANGRVKAVEQVDATSQAFFEATRRQALAKWRFKPASRGGVAEESWMTLSVRFEIKNQ